MGGDVSGRVDPMAPTFEEFSAASKLPELYAIFLQLAMWIGALWMVGLRGWPYMCRGLRMRRVAVQREAFLIRGNRVLSAFFKIDNEAELANRPHCIVASAVVGRIAECRCFGSRVSAFETLPTRGVAKARGFT